MGLGMDLEVKNSRYHTALDLTSHKDIRDLIAKTLETKTCTICHRQFDFHVHQYVCRICFKVICECCSGSEYYFYQVEDHYKDLLECRCNICYNLIKTHEGLLTDAIKSNILDDIVVEYDKITTNQIKIDCKLKMEAERETVRLQTETKINLYLDNLKTVDNHKTIIKSVSVLEDMITKATEESIDVDTSVIDRVNFDKNRLLAEKELR